MMKKKRSSLEKFSNRTFESLRDIKFLSKQDLERGGRENSPRLRIKRKKEKGNEKQRAEEGRHPLKKLQSRSSRLIRAWEEEWECYG